MVIRHPRYPQYDMQQRVQAFAYTSALLMPARGGRKWALIINTSSDICQIHLGAFKSAEPWSAINLAQWGAFQIDSLTPWYGEVWINSFEGTGSGNVIYTDVFERP